VATETIVGVVFSVALAMGSMMASGEELIDALFGGAGALSRAEIIFGLAGSCVVVAFILTQKNKLVVMLVSSEVAKTAGINVRLLDFLYLEMFSLTIALGLRYLGAPS
jgi:ABC-type Mn2+/Zn2+ transport system permease subunit